MAEQRIITLTTDFGLRDYFVGAMKGVIYNIYSNVNIVDISHNIRAHDVFEAAITLKNSYKYFPERTIHIVVVDPGVGGLRRPLLVYTENQYFIGPDNGVFTPLVQKEEDVMVIDITADHYFLKDVSYTFHGRDIFAPIAAYLAKGVDLRSFGDPIEDFIKIDLPKPKAPDKNTLEGQIIYADNFGNLVSNISSNHFQTFLNNSTNKTFKIKIGTTEIGKVSKFYEELTPGSIGALFGSTDHLEFSLFKESAEKKLGIKPKERVLINFS
ncbi:SAM-dependent chlorinase/fluorinase, partial [bacterium]|nr:SAM-dependent chlorinase/fluorinase [bacterium]